jgi:hypothetical protein
VSARDRIDRVVRVPPAPDALDVAGDDSINAARIGIVANIVNLSARALVLVVRVRVRRFNGAVGME